MKGILVYLFLFVPISLFAQLVLITPSESYSPETKFSNEYVKQHKIKKILCKVIYKPDNKVMEDKGLVKVYEFNQAGNIKYAYFTSIKEIKKTEKYSRPVYNKRGKLIVPARPEITQQYIYDTIFTYYFYNERQNLVMKRNSTASDFFNAVYYSYDTLNRITKVVNCKETNKGSSVHEFALGVQTIMSTDSIEYIIQNEKQWRKRYFNDDGKVYKEGIVNLSPLMRTEVYVFSAGGLRITNFFNYKEDGTLVESLFDSNAEDNISYKCIYEYNDKRPVAEKIFKNNVKTHDVNYLYDGGAKFLKSSISRNFIKNTIEILKFEYQFYD